MLSPAISPNVAIPQIVVSWLWIVLTTISTPFFYKQRNNFPIKGRDPELLWAIYVISCISRLNDAFAWYTWFPCRVSSPIRIICYVTTLWIYVIRAWNLLFRYQITAVLLKVNTARKEGRTTVSVLDSWYVRNRFLSRPSFLFGTFLFQVLFSIGYISFDFSKGSSVGWCQTDGERLSNDFGRLHILILLIIGVFVAYQLSKTPGDDAHGVKTELKWSALNMIVFQISYLVWKQKVGAVPLVLNGYEWDYRLLLTIIPMTLGYVLPLYRSYKIENQPYSQNNNQSNITLNGVLNTEEGISAFFSFVEKEFSAENLMYYLQVKEWINTAKKHPQLTEDGDVKVFQTPSQTSQFFLPTPTGSPSKKMDTFTHFPMTSSSSNSAPSSSAPSSASVSLIIEDHNIRSNSPISHTRVGLLRSTSAPQQMDAILSQKANEMLENYLIDNAKFAVNLSSIHRDQIIKAIHDYADSGYSVQSLLELISAFQTTSNEIFILMETDSFFRFLQSPMYEKYKVIFNQKTQAKNSSKNETHPALDSGATHVSESLTMILIEEAKNRQTQQQGGSSGVGASTGDSHSQGSNPNSPRGLGVEYSQNSNPNSPKLTPRELGGGSPRELGGSPRELGVPRRGGGTKFNFNLRSESQSIGLDPSEFGERVVPTPRNDGEDNKYQHIRAESNSSMLAEPSTFYKPPQGISGELSVVEEGDSTPLENGNTESSIIGNLNDLEEEKLIAVEMANLG